MKAYVVDSAAVRSNLQQLQTRAGSAVLWAVLKGDGYGLGLLPMAAICREAGVTHFAVTEVSEVSRLRAGGFADASILMLRPTSEQDELRQLLQLGAILTVSSQNDAAVLNGVAQELGVQAEVHVKIDTGMGRYGFLPDELDQLLPIFRYMPGLHVTGIYTHLHSAFCSQKATIAQAEAFQGVLDQLHAADCETGMAHMLNSAGLLKYPQYAMDGVRVGSAILGRVSVRGNFGLTRIGECQATVEELRWLPKGHSCGYGAGWPAKKPTRVAVFSVGWYHGFGVEMGNDLFRFRDCLRGVLRNLRQMIFRKHITVTVNGKKGRDSAPQIVSVSIEGVRSEVMLHTLEDRGIYVSAGSACSSNKPAVSATLTAIGLKKNLLDSTIRFSFCVNTTEEEIDYALSVMQEVIPRLQKYTRR